MLCSMVCHAVLLDVHSFVISDRVTIAVALSIHDMGLPPAPTWPEVYVIVLFWHWLLLLLLLLLIPHPAHTMRLGYHMVRTAHTLRSNKQQQQKPVPKSACQHTCQAEWQRLLKANSDQGGRVGGAVRDADSLPLHDLVI